MEILTNIRINRSIDLEFEWDAAKAQTNYAKHGIKFEDVLDIFDDIFAFEEEDDRKNYGEKRLSLTGMTRGEIITVIYTQRGEKIRLISARRANKNDRADYYGTATRH
jgi:uncharacterized protein